MHRAPPISPLRRRHVLWLFILMSWLSDGKLATCFLDKFPRSNIISVTHGPTGGRDLRQARTVLRHYNINESVRMSFYDIDASFYATYTSFYGILVSGKEYFQRPLQRHNDTPGSTWSDAWWCARYCVCFLQFYRHGVGRTNVWQDMEFYLPMVRDIRVSTVQNTGM